MESHAGASDGPTGDVLHRPELAGDIQREKADASFVEAEVKGQRDDRPDASSRDELLPVDLPASDVLAAHPHAADAQLVRLLASRGFAGPLYDAFHEKIVKYGQKVCMSWINKGVMHDKCAERGRAVPSFPEQVERQDRWDLATDTAVEGAAMFRRTALIGGQWSPDGRASLTTFYIGACVLVYPTVYRRWLKDRRMLRQLLVTQRVPEEVHEGPDSQVRHRLILEQLRRKLGDRDYTVLEMHFQGYTYAAIGDRIGVSSKSVDGYLQRAKAKARRILEQEGGLDD